MTDKSKIAEAVVKMMKTVGYVQKTGENKFQGYKYASIEGILEKVQPALVECGLMITQNEVSHEIIADGNLMEAVYEFQLLHISGETLPAIRQTGLSALRNSKGGYDDKSLNKCHTTARKYFILGLFQIPTGLGVDPDSDEDKPEVSAPVQNTPRNPNASLQKAKEWTNTAIKQIGELKNEREADDWYAQWAGHMARLKASAPDEGAQVTAALKEQRTSFKPNVLAEG